MPVSAPARGAHYDGGEDDVVGDGARQRLEAGAYDRVAVRERDTDRLVRARDAAARVAV